MNVFAIIEDLLFLLRSPKPPYTPNSVAIFFVKIVTYRGGQQKRPPDSSTVLLALLSDRAQIWRSWEGLVS